MSLGKFIDDNLNSRSIWETFEELESSLKRTFTTPHIDMYNVLDGVELKADLPGFNKDNLDLVVDGNILTLSGNREDIFTNEEKGKWYYSERKVGKFSRQVKLPFMANPNKIRATFNDGVLSVFIENSQDLKNRIQID